MQIVLLTEINLVIDFSACCSRGTLSTLFPNHLVLEENLPGKMISLRPNYACLELAKLLLGNRI
jgi:hypothetical protein